MTPRGISRRTFIKVAGLGAVGAGAAAVGVPRVLEALGPALAPPAERSLVVVELAGGNDGLSMVVPYATAAYLRHRKRTAIQPGTVLRLNAAAGLHPNLKRLHRRGVAIIQGVGVPHPDLSHFEMMRRWWGGDGEGRDSSATGFLGRLSDVIGDAGAPAVGVSLGSAPSPALLSRKVVTASLPSADARLLTPEDAAIAPVWRAAYRAMTHPERAETMRLLGAARKGAADALRLAEVIRQLPPAAKGYPESDLGAQLSFAARVLAARMGVRVVHVPAGGDFDTHENHLATYDSLMEDFDASLDAFLEDIRQRGLGRSVVVMTTSEFGRRVTDNGSSGLDHGAASVAVLAGAVRPGLHGEAPSLDRLDGDQNLVAGVRLEEYFATVAEGWLGVPASEVLAGSPRPLRGVF